MRSSEGNLINAAIQRSLAPNCKKKITDFDDHIVASARRVVSTKIEYVLAPQFSTTSFLASLKTKCSSFKSDKTKRKKLKKKKKKKSKRRSFDNPNDKKMKNTESGQELTLPDPKIVLFPPDNVQLGWKGSLPVGSGFVNLGTTCYINSTLQALFHVPSFVNWLMGDRKHHISCEKINGMLHTECLVCAMSKTLQASHRLSGGSVRPRHIIEKVKIICKHLSPFRQEDAHEFLRYLMEAMEKSYISILGIQAKKLDNFSKETTPLNQIFGGYIRTEVTCMECSHVSTTFQHFQDLILDIRQASTSTVFDALENYFSKERLDGDEAYHCERCKKKVSAYKKFAIEKAPNVLCIQLKRFNISSFYGGSKISKLITIPQTIDLCKFKHRNGTQNGTPMKYRLVSMVFHHGPSAYSGHYTALGCTSSGSYYYFNDDQVYATHLGQYTNNPNAYIMFYELEKSSAADHLASIKIAATNSVLPSLSNGCLNGSASQRTNGYFKRENSFSSTFNHHWKPSWELNNNENKSPIKAVAPINAASSSTATTSSSSCTSSSYSASSATCSGAHHAAAKTSSTSLVPYMSSDSESSDSEIDQQPRTDSNNNTTRPANVARYAAGPSPLAKKNSTLTSLLATSPQTDNGVAYRASSSASSSSLGSCVSSTSSRSPSANGKGSSRTDVAVAGDADESSGATTSASASAAEPKAEKRGFIPFNIFSRSGKLKTESKGESSRSGGGGGGGTGTADDEPKSKSTKQMLVGIAAMYFSSKDVKKDGVEEKTKMNGSCSNAAGGHEAATNNEGGASYAERMRLNGAVNGGGGEKTTLTNGSDKSATNEWIVTDIDDDMPNGSGTGVGEKNATSKLMQGEWIVTEKGDRKLMSPTRNYGKSNEIRENGRKCNGDVGNDCKNDSSRNDFHDDASSSFGHSSLNGYGGKVLTWNGDLSHINREVDEERKEAAKRSHEYDDEQDRGKVKKSKYFNRSDNHSHMQSPRKNVIQQYHNRYNQTKRPWSFHQNSNHYNNKRYHNGNFHRPNNGYGYRHVNYVQQREWRR